jgi:hypothetical protein
MIPNDDCLNSFNRSWIRWVGASPLMYVPNLFAILFVGSGLRGVHPRLNGLLAAGACLGALLLGLGHMTRLIW